MVNLAFKPLNRGFTKSSVSQFRRVGNICCGNKCCCSKTRRWFCLRSKRFLLAGNKFCFPSCICFAVDEDNVDFPVLLSNGKRTIKDGGDVDVKEPEASHRKEKSKKKEFERRGYKVCHCLAHEDYINGNKKEVAYCQIGRQMSEKYSTSRSNYNSK